MRFRVGVRIPEDLDPRMFIAYDAIERAWFDVTEDDEDAPTEATLTHWEDGDHGVGSYHKRRGRAVDVRTKSIRKDLVPKFEAAVRSRIGHLGFDVVLEDFNPADQLRQDNEHLHVELDRRADG